MTRPSDEWSLDDSAPELDVGSDGGSSDRAESDSGWSDSGWSGDEAMDEVDGWTDLVDDADDRLAGRYEVVPTSFGEVALPPGSALYVGKVRHRRFTPRQHRLAYKVWYLLADVDDLWRLDEKVDGFRHNRRARVEFRDSDHFGPADRNVRGKLAEFLAARGHELPEGRVLVLTYPRVHGHVFNPISFWFCHGPEGRLELVVAEVNNTFGDSYSYVLDDLEDLGGNRVRAEADKFLHVSPFLPVADHRYRFTIRRPTAEPGSTLAVQLDVHQGDGERVLDATLSLKRVELTSAMLKRVVRRHPLVTIRTVVGIHWHAVRIWLRRKARFHRRPEPLPDDYPRDRAADRAA